MQSIDATNDVQKDLNTMQFHINIVNANAMSYQYRQCQCNVVVSMQSLINNIVNVIVSMQSIDATNDVQKDPSALRWHQIACEYIRCVIGVRYMTWLVYLLVYIFSEIPTLPAIRIHGRLRLHSDKLISFVIIFSIFFNSGKNTVRNVN